MPAPLLFPALSLGLGAVSTIPQWMTAFNQDERADELASGLVRPRMDVPESQKRALMSAEEQAKMTRLPGQSGIEGRLDQTTANKIAMIERLGTGGPTSINAASRAYGQQMDAENELGIKAADMYLRNQDVLRNELGQTAGYEQQAWNWNERMPFEQKQTAIEALREGSIRNKNAAFKDLVGGLSSFFGGMGTPTEGFDWQSMFGGDGGSAGMQGMINTSAPNIGQNDPSSFLYGTNTVRKARNFKPVLDSFNI